MIRDYPDVRQVSDFDCGRAAVEGLLAFHKSPGLRLAHTSDPVQGLSPDNVEMLLRGAGLRVLAGSLQVADLKHFTETRRPVLTLVQLEGVGHWTAVTGVGTRRVYYHCPVHGPTSRTLADWRRQWYDTARNGVRLDGYGIVGWLYKRN